MNKKNVKRLITVLFCFVTLLAVTCVYSFALGGSMGYMQFAYSLMPIKTIESKGIGPYGDSFVTSFEGTNNVLFDDLNSLEGTKQGVLLKGNMDSNNTQINEEILYNYNNLSTTSNGLSVNSCVWSVLYGTSLEYAPTTQINWTHPGVVFPDVLTYNFQPFVYRPNVTFTPVFGQTGYSLGDYNMSFNVFGRFDKYIMPNDSSSSEVYMPVTYFYEYNYIDNNGEVVNVSDDYSYYAKVGLVGAPNNPTYLSDNIYAIPQTILDISDEILFTTLRVEFNLRTLYYQAKDGTYKYLSTDDPTWVYNFRSTQKYTTRDCVPSLIDSYVSRIESGYYIPDDYSVDMASWLTSSIGAFLDAELFPGFSFGGMLAVVVAVPLATIFLKKFAGG